MNNRKIWFAGIYYVIAVMLYVLNMFFEAVRPGVLATVFLICVAIELFIRKDITFAKFIDKLVAAYIAYNTLSVIWLVKSGMPYTVYIQEFVVSLLPVIFYYTAHDGTSWEPVGFETSEKSGRSGKFYRNFVYAVLILGVLGILLQIIMPQFYIDYSYRLSFVSKADAATCRVRMDSVVGSTVLGFISVAAMLASIPFVMYGAAPVSGTVERDMGDKTGASVKDASGIKRIRLFGIVSFLINMTVAFMSNQRSAMVVAILVILYFNYLIFFVFRTLDRKYFIVELIIVLAAFAGLCAVRMDAVMKIYYRLVSLPDAIGERSEQWIAAVNNMYSTWLGNGLGANGHKALGIEDAHVIADGGLVKLYCEQGIFGFSMFIYIMILSLRKGLKNLGTSYVELGIVAVALLQSVGSNILAFQLTTPIFWYAVGSIHHADDRVKNS
ncbi:MAG: hypothetical protein IJT37_09840 [Lachnospiraceae bacterium]|nr:hypothetical protein [Lachnospiraceae bacterium]